MNENIWKDMYLTLFRGIAEAMELLPVSIESEAAALRLNRAIQEAEEYYMTHAEEESKESYGENPDFG